jgi:hypothetical protein
MWRYQENERRVHVSIFSSLFNILHRRDRLGYYQQNFIEIPKGNWHVSGESEIEIDVIEIIDVN